jgi:ribosomal protein S18 acetylase RimI-like enzyme
MPLRTDGSGPQVLRLDLHAPDHVAGLQALLSEYALSAEGGGQALAPEALARLPQALASRSHYVGWLACADGRFIGLLNAFEGLSTFKARPLLNIHDIVVTATWRGRGVGRALIAQAQAHAQAGGCCKLTLEVLEGNARAIGLYRAMGFDPYELDPAMGRAMFFEKWLD